MTKKVKNESGDLRQDAAFNEAVQLLSGETGLLDNIMDSLGDGLSIQDKHMRIVYQNQFMIENFGHHIGKHCYKIYENRDEICEGCPLEESYRTGKVSRALRVGTTKEGKKNRFEIVASLLRNSQGEVVAGMEAVRLVEDREQALDELREAVEKLMQAKAVYENSSEGIMVIDPDNRIVTVNPAFESITGYSADESNGSEPDLFKSELQPAEFYSEMWRSLDETGSWHGELWDQHKDGHTFALSMNINSIFNENGELKQRVCVFTDITEKKLAEQRIKHMAHHDALTNLPNRILFSDRLNHGIAVAKREKSRLALLYVDLDNFKPVNDEFGHSAGDTLLQMVAQRMNDCVRESDTVARIGGDEFAVLLVQLHSRHDAEIVAEKLRIALETPFEIESVQLNISCSIGGAYYPEDGVNEQVLIRNADQAMYQAKASGRNQVCFINTIT